MPSLVGSEMCIRDSINAEYMGKRKKKILHQQQLAQIMDWKNRLENVQNKVKSQLHAKNLDDLDYVANWVEQFDSDRNGYLDKNEFNKFLSKIGVFLTSQELTCVYQFFDQNGDGRISYAEFIQTIRTNMSDLRLSTVKHAFKFLDKSKSGVIPIEDLVNAYKASDHPRVRTRQKTIEVVKLEFQNAISKKSRDGVNITESDFLEYYLDVNATLPAEKEQYFCDLVLKTWGITTGVDYVSPERLSQLEGILYEKVRQKTVGQDDEGKTLKKAFKYFDVADKGVITLEQFTDALKKFGCVFTEYEINALFNKYQTDQSGKLAYDEFCNLFASMGAGTNPNVNPVFQLSREPPREVLTRVSEHVQKRGIYGLRDLSLTLRRTDKAKRGVLDRTSFAWALKEVGLILTKTETDKLFKYFDKNCDDCVNYPEFIHLLRGPSSPERLQVLRAAFSKLEAQGNGVVTLADLTKGFNATILQEVASGKKKAEDAVREFVTRVEPARKDGVVTYEEFEDVYRDVGPSIDGDSWFNAMLCRAWGLTEVPLTSSQKTVSFKQRNFWGQFGF
eukprot:TRINITY_DN5743_c0_g1_i10.p1 TRINITY_DN5743_c0_g1~~TRINITY_DN5743_c0_g1_i10.p1  ORF type:complete len:561 (+),score=190.53 TRINITY_DN5743_c0_g1_i10:73-1755(+)